MAEAQLPRSPGLTELRVSPAFASPDLATLAPDGSTQQSGHRAEPTNPDPEIPTPTRRCPEGQI
jgi:hypothetical protein